MGLFSRTNEGGSGRDDFDEIDLPTSDDLKGGLFTSEDTSVVAQATPAPARRSAAVPTRNGYGIEDAIKLMRSLPRDNNEVVVTVVKKTLESTNIQVPDIVVDANEKEARIRDHHETLEGEIKDLQEQIAQRNQQISDLLHDLKETTDVRQRLQLAMELDGYEEPKTQPVVSQSQKTAPASEPAVEKDTSIQSAPPQATPTATPVGEQNSRRRAQHRTNPPH